MLETSLWPTITSFFDCQSHPLLLNGAPRADLTASPEYFPVLKNWLFAINHPLSSSLIDGYRPFTVIILCPPTVFLVQSKTFQGP